MTSPSTLSKTSCENTRQLRRGGSTPKRFGETSQGFAEEDLFHFFWVNPHLESGSHEAKRKSSLQLYPMLQPVAQQVLLVASALMSPNKSTQNAAPTSLPPCMMSLACTASVGLFEWHRTDLDLLPGRGPRRRPRGGRAGRGHRLQPGAAAVSYFAARMR